MLNLKKFTINKLYGYQDVTIDFVDNKKIIVAENGSGKTTILNIMYYCLLNSVSGLDKFDFESCILEFEDIEKEKHKVVFSKDKMNNIKRNNEYSTRPRYRIRFNKMVEDKLNLIVIISDNILKNSGTNSLEKTLFEWASFLKNIESDPVLRTLKINDKKNAENFISNTKTSFLNKILSDVNIYLGNSDWSSYKILLDIEYKDFLDIDMFLSRRSFIDEYNYELNYEKKDKVMMGREFVFHFKRVVRSLVERDIKDNEGDKKLLESIKTIFLPTYRRIEQDSRELISEDFIVKDESNMIFGMSDVINTFNLIFNRLGSFINDSFNNINERALNNLISGEHDVDFSIEKWIDISYFDDVMDVVGNQIDVSNQSILKELYKYRNEDEKFLLKLIKRMCEIYDKQLIVHNEIDKFVSVCNKYLKSKKIKYNKKMLTIEVLQKNAKCQSYEVAFPSLSSGEKQIISLFARLYLTHLPDINFENPQESTFPKYWILFDEPELSLSVKWQEMLLPDIMKSERCHFLFSTTHSPFIFNNDFEIYTSDMSLSITEVHNV